MLDILWEASVTAAYASAILIVLRLILRKRAPRQVFCLLWLVVFARLLIPVSLESPLSIVPEARPAQGQLYLPQQDAGQQPANPVAPTAPVQNPGQAANPVISNPNPPALTLPGDEAPAAPLPEAPAPFPWRAVITGVWLAGGAAMGSYGLISYLRLRRRLFGAIRAKDGAWEHPAVDSPFILGMLRPRIYLPAGLAGPARGFILCHERAHLRRLDHIVKPVCWAALALHWFNPLVWAAYVLMSRDIEAACDEAVVRQLGPQVKADYSYTLLALATGRRLPAPSPLAFDEGDAKGRIKHVLGYRRPALWVIVVSSIAAVLAAVCLLTDPVSARNESEPIPDPTPTATQGPEAGLSALLDPWMKEVLDGERQFISAYSHYAEGDGRTYGIHDLRTFYYGDNQFPDAVVEAGRLAVIDLDRDGVNELVIWPEGEYEYLYSVVGYVILRRQGDEIYAYNPVYRTFGDLKSDGTFSWSNSAAWGGYATLTFGPGEVVLQETTYHKPGENGIDQLYFVDGRRAAQEEFHTAVDAQYAKPNPVWYVYEDGVLKYAPINVPIPLDDYAQAAPVPDFLDEEQQLLYRQTYTMYEHIFVPNTEEVDNWPGGGGYSGGGAVDHNGWSYVPATGLYCNWTDFQEAVLSVFTQEYWDARNDLGDGQPIYANIGGQLHYVAAARGNRGNNTYFPETFHLVSRTEDSISFVTTAYYTEHPGSVPQEGWDAYLQSRWDYSLEFPIRMVKTENGWRFDEFYCPMTDDNGRFQQIPNPSKVPTRMDILSAAPLDAPVVNISNELPDDPDEWYKVAELPDDMIWVFSRDCGSKTLIRWDGNFIQSFDHTAHTIHCMMPQLKKLGGPNTYGPLAVISEVNSGSSCFGQGLVVYDLDAAPAAVDYAHDWRPLMEDFNNSSSCQYDSSTHVATLTYQGKTVVIPLADMLSEERLAPGNITLSITGDQVYYFFDETNDSRFQLDLGVQLLIDGLSTECFPSHVTCTLQFNGKGFDMVPGSCELQ